MGVSTAMDFPASSGSARRMRPLIVAVPLLWALVFVAVYAVGSRSHSAPAAHSGMSAGTTLSSAQSASLLGTGAAAPAVQGVTSAPAPPALAALTHPKPRPTKHAPATTSTAAPVVTRPATVAPRVSTPVVSQPVVSVPRETPVVTPPVTPIVSRPAPVSQPQHASSGTGSTGSGVVSGGG